MAFKVKSLPKSGGSFADMKELGKAKALLIEPKRLELQRASGNYGAKDTIHADVTVFGDLNSVATATPTEVQAGTMFQGSIIVRDLTDSIDEAVIVTVTKENFKSGNSGWVMRDVDAEVQAKVVEYAEAREAEIGAAMDEAPDEL
jgi:hypothetical protein